MRVHSQGFNEHRKSITTYMSLAIEQAMFNEGTIVELMFLFLHTSREGLDCNCEVVDESLAETLAFFSANA